MSTDAAAIPNATNKLAARAPQSAARACDVDGEGRTARDSWCDCANMARLLPTLFRTLEERLCDCLSPGSSWGGAEKFQENATGRNFVAQGALGPPSTRRRARLYDALRTMAITSSSLKMWFDFLAAARMASTSGLLGSMPRCFSQYVTLEAPDM